MKSPWILALACLLFSCKEQSTPSGTGASVAAPDAGLTAILSAAPGGEAKAIHVARTTAKPGEELTLSGRIMGNSNPFVEGRAAFILGDPELLTPCNEIPGDSCETPWDCCCDSSEDKKAGIATIQITGPDGRVLKKGLEGVGGLAKLATVTVTGKVAKGSSAESLVINATAIQVK
jgi:hypothetical protein